MYYLQSRYYDPQTGRFINADDTNYLNATGTVLGCNLFAYCENDPVNFVDETGYAASNFAKTTRVNTIINKCISAFESKANRSIFKNVRCKPYTVKQYSCYQVEYYKSGEQKGSCYIYYVDNYSSVIHNRYSRRVIGKVICLTVAEWKAYMVARHYTLYYKIQDEL